MQWFWRIDKGGVLPGYPVRLSRMWFGLPADFSHVDAAYESLAHEDISLRAAIHAIVAHPAFGQK